jgi:hypothetical protein
MSRRKGIKGRNYIPLPQQTPVNLEKLKHQKKQQKKWKNDEEQENIMEQLRQNRLQRESQQQSANQVPFTIKQKKEFKNCKELNEMVDLITNIYTNNKKSYTTSKGLTTDIMKLKDIVQKIEGNPGIKEAVDNLDKSIKGEKKEGKKEGKKEEDGTTTTVQTGLSTSYLMIQSAIIKYAQTIKCPKKEESLDDIINYFYKWATTNISVYNGVLRKMILDEREPKSFKKLTKKEEKKYEENKKKFPFPQIIFPLYIIIKSLLKNKLYNSGKEHSITRSSTGIINFTDYLNTHSNDVKQKYLKSIFAPFFDRYFKPDFESKNKRLLLPKIPKKSSSQPQLLQYNISPLGKKNFKEYFERPDLITFIDNFENLLKILPYIDQNAFKEHFNTGENKTFKKHLYESILNHEYNYIGPHFSYGGKILSRQPWTNVDFEKAKNKGFRQWFEMILSRKLLGVDKSSNYDRALRNKTKKKNPVTFRNKTRKKSPYKGENNRNRRGISNNTQGNDTRSLRPVTPKVVRDRYRNRRGISNNTQGNDTRSLRPVTPKVVRDRYRNPAWTDENNNKRFARKNNPSPSSSRKKSKKKTEDEKLQKLLGRNKTNGLRAKPLQGMGDVEYKTAKFFENQLKLNNDTNLKANKFGGKKKKHTKRNKKRHNKNKYTKKNK